MNLFMKLAAFTLSHKDAIGKAAITLGGAVLGTLVAGVADRQIQRRSRCEYDESIEVVDMDDETVIPNTGAVSETTYSYGEDSQK